MSLALLIQKGWRGWFEVKDKSEKKIHIKANMGTLRASTHGYFQFSALQSALLERRKQAEQDITFVFILWFER